MKVYTIEDQKGNVLLDSEDIDSLIGAVSELIGLRSTFRFADVLTMRGDNPARAWLREYGYALTVEQVPA